MLFQGKQLPIGVKFLMNKKRETKIVKANIVTSRVAVLVLCVHNSALQIAYMCMQQHHTSKIHKQLLKRRGIGINTKQNQCPLVVGNFSAQVGKRTSLAIGIFRLEIICDRGHTLAEWVRKTTYITNNVKQ